jgi:hypothetical protein
MTRNKLAIALAALAVSASAFAGNSVYSGGGIGGSTSNNISGSVSVVNGGFSESQATSNQSVYGTLSPVVTGGTTSLNGQNVPTKTAGISGVVNMSSSDTAWNYSTGSGNGDASAKGSLGGGVGGNTVIGTVATGSGYANLGGSDSIQAETNQGGYTASVGNVSFGSTQTVSQNNGTFGVSSVLTGNGTISNGEGAMSVNGATLSDPKGMSIQDGGSFSSSGSAATGLGSSVSLNGND